MKDKNGKEVLLIYVDTYFRITGRKEGTLKREYASVSGTVNGTFSSERYEAYREQITQEYINDGYLEVVVTNCSKEEFETGVFKKETSLGYIQWYLNTTYSKDSEERYAPVNGSCDFNKFFDQELFLHVIHQLNEFYREQGMTNVKTETITKEVYEQLIKNTEEEFHISWRD